MTKRLRTQSLLSETPPRKACCLLLLPVLALLPLLAAQPAWSQTYRVLYSFTGGDDGASPQSSLIRDAEGNLYGTTYKGGAFHYGTVFRLDPTGKERNLHSFDGVDGMWSSSSLLRDAAGTLYGTTQDGGTPEGGGCRHGCGTVFKVDTAGKETVLYAFTGKAGGALPYAGVVRDGNGNLYGTTYWGGHMSACGDSGCGTVFKLDTAGKETVLHAFTGGADGGHPYGDLTLDVAGNLYGATELGGDLSGCQGFGCGTVFKVDTAGKETVLYQFTGGADGGGPVGVIRDAAGTLYGATMEGGTAGWGTVFKLDTSGKESVLYAFTDEADGGMPSAGVVRDAEGNIYGTTAHGGDYSGSCANYGCGVVFKVDKRGREKALYAFTDVSAPALYFPAGVILDKAGNLYGTYPYGGTTRRCNSECGFVFKITQ
jgi:uncharacterized repeat protein (TIGR03803 family)